MITFLLIKTISVVSISSSVPVQNFIAIYICPILTGMCHSALWLTVNLIFTLFLCYIYSLTCKNLVVYVCGIIINRSLRNHFHRLFENKLILSVSIAKMGGAKAGKC